MSKRELRAERDRVARLLRDAPLDRSRLLAPTTEQRQHAEQGLADATAQEQAAQRRLAELGGGTERLLRRRELAQARDCLALAHTARTLARSRPTVPPTGNATPGAPSRPIRHGANGTPTC